MAVAFPAAVPLSAPPTAALPVVVVVVVDSALPAVLAALLAALLAAETTLLANELEFDSCALSDWAVALTAPVGGRNAVERVKEKEQHEMSGSASAPGWDTEGGERTEPPSLVKAEERHHNAR